MNTIVDTKTGHIWLPLLALFVCLSFLGSFVIYNKQANAAPVIGFNAGNIIDDFVFTNSSTMSAQQIQVFLNSRVPICDTNGTRVSEFGGGTRAQWAAARGHSPPFTCLKDFSEGGKSSAQIIFDVAQQFSINPQVLIVLLEKEQGLITDDWPIPGSSQYRTATGYGCPDTAACASQYFGLTNQLTWSGRMFRAIMNASPTWFTPYVVGNNFIQFSPNAACGGTVVNIQNRSTQALYNYTPYQPNPGALAAGFGTAPCGAYGNRNFYLYFTAWFGSVRANDSLNPHPDGTLLNIDNKVYLVDRAALHHVVNGSVFYSNSFQYSDIKPPTTGDRRLSISTPLDLIKQGSLYSDESGVYTTVNEGGEWVRQMVSYNSFVNLGYTFDKVRAVPRSEMPARTSATILTSDRHPNGSLIKNSSGVFYIDNSTKRYVSAAVFISHRWSWGNIYPETSSDSALARGADMLFREGSVLLNNGNLFIVELPPSGPEIKRPIGPWSCFSNILRYSIQEVVLVDNASLPVQTGPNIGC